MIPTPEQEAKLAEWLASLWPDFVAKKIINDIKPIAEGAKPHNERQRQVYAILFPEGEGENNNEL